MKNTLTIGAALAAFTLLISSLFGQEQVFTGEVYSPGKDKEGRSTVILKSGGKKYLLELKGRAKSIYSLVLPKGKKARVSLTGKIKPGSRQTIEVTSYRVAK